MASRSFLKYYVVDPFFAALVFLLYGIFALLPWKFSSDLGAALAGRIGPLLSPHRTMLANLRYIFPEKTDRERDAIAKDVWNNLGRTAMEYPHLPRMQKRLGDILNVDGEEVLKTALAAGKPILFFSGHIGNWEVLPPYLASKGVGMSIVYRKANNRFIDWLIQRARGATAFHFIPKGREGSRDLINAFASNGRIAMLIDQRMSDGEELDFLGKKAWTGTAAARLALKYGALCVPFEVVREKGQKLLLRFYPPMAMPQGENAAENARQLTQQMNDVISAFIRARPGLWLWLHRRWGRDAHNATASAK